MGNDTHGEPRKKLTANVCKVSFYSRYTRDIAAFADKYTEGKVVSVLEGGYSDRALTSAAMGHIVGMRGSLPEGCDEWWAEKELISVGPPDCLHLSEYFGLTSDLAGKGNQKEERRQTCPSSSRVCFTTTSLPNALSPRPF